MNPRGLTLLMQVLRQVPSPQPLAPGPRRSCGVARRAGPGPRGGDRRRGLGRRHRCFRVGKI